MAELTKRDEDRLRGFPAHYRDLAIKAIESGRAFCPSCNFAGHSNCAHFNECDAFIEPQPLNAPVHGNGNTHGGLMMAEIEDIEEGFDAGEWNNLPSSHGGRMDIIDLITRDVSELGDRTSPDDRLEMMLVSADELRIILENRLSGERTQTSDALVGDQPFVEMLWKWFEDRGVDLKPERSTGMTADDFRAMLDEHEAAVTSDIAKKKLFGRSVMSEPRFFIDHGIIHDRFTGKHVVTDGEPPFEDSLEQVLALLNGMAKEIDGLIVPVGGARNA